MFTLLLLAVFTLSLIGFGNERMHPEPLYAPQLSLRSLNVLLTLAACVLIAAAYMPHNHVKKEVGQPMLAGVAVWVVLAFWLHGLLIGMNPTA